MKALSIYGLFEEHEKHCLVNWIYDVFIVSWFKIESILSGLSYNPSSYMFYLSISSCKIIDWFIYCNSTSVAIILACES